MEVLDSEVQKYLSGLGQRGGAMTLQRHGLQKMKEWASRGGQARAAKYSPEQRRAWARLGGLARKAQLDAGA